VISSIVIGAASSAVHIAALQALLCTPLLIAGAVLFFDLGNGVARNIFRPSSLSSLIDGAPYRRSLGAMLFIFGSVFIAASF
jgi:hypothetical protein